MSERCGRGGVLSESGRFWKLLMNSLFYNVFFGSIISSHKVIKTRKAVSIIFRLDFRLNA